MLRMEIYAALLMVAILAVGQSAHADVIHYVRFQHDGGVSYGILKGAEIAELSEAPYRAPTETGRTFARKSVRLLAPSEPSKVIAVGLNFASHAGQAGAAKPELFAKLPSSLVGHEAVVQLPRDAGNLHFEGELVVVIGRRARDITAEEAPAHILGVTAGNDLSERSWQSADLQWLRAKGADGFGPAGPAIAVGLDYNDLLIETRVNGELKQSESSAKLLHSVDQIVAYASRYFTLEPGDMIFTGTPGRTERLSVGDTVDITIEGIGTLSNKIGRRP